MGTGHTDPLDSDARNEIFPSSILYVAHGFERELSRRLPSHMRATAVPADRIAGHRRGIAQVAG